MTRQFISVMAYQKSIFLRTKFQKPQRIQNWKDLCYHGNTKTSTSFNNFMGMGEYLLQRKGSDSSHELNLACCQREGRPLYCLSVRVIVKAVFAKTATSFLQNTLLKPHSREFYPYLLKPHANDLPNKALI